MNFSRDFKRALIFCFHQLVVSHKAPEERYSFGRISGYYIGYKPVQSTQAFIYKTIQLDDKVQLLDRTETILKGLSRSTKYEVVVQAFNR